MDAVAYVRVSSKAQTHAMQKAALEMAAKARGDTVARWYSDKLSGGTMARPGLERLRADARAGKVRRVYVYRLDRLTRSGIRDTLEVVDELRAHGCKVATAADGFDLDGPAAEVVLAVLSWAAKMERLAINERIAAARLHVEAEGGKWGRPRSIGDAQVKRAGALRRKGLSVRAIASRMGLPKSTLDRALRAL
jgi:DNA invertase Pin-like site-specific DNA recombinase